MTFERNRMRIVYRQTLLPKRDDMSNPRLGGDTSDRVLSKPMFPICPEDYVYACSSQLITAVFASSIASASNCSKEVSRLGLKVVYEYSCL
jgi:hypothetical protein